MFLRIQATDTALSQLLYTPAASASPGAVIANFNDAILADSDATQLSSGFITMQMPAAIADPILMATMGRLLQPFNGYVEIDVNGTYSVSGEVTTVMVDTIATCDIQPS